MISDPIAALKAWKDYVIKLGNKDPLPQSDRIESPHSKYDDKFGHKVLHLLNNSLSQDGSLLELVDPFKWDEIHQAVCELDSGSAPGPDQISNELLRLAGLGFAMAVAQLFNEIWSSLTWPSVWRVANLIPIY